MIDGSLESNDNKKGPLSSDGSTFTSYADSTPTLYDKFQELPFDKKSDQYNFSVDGEVFVILKYTDKEILFKNNLHTVDNAFGFYKSNEKILNAITKKEGALPIQKFCNRIVQHTLAEPPKQNYFYFPSRQFLACGNFHLTSDNKIDMFSTPQCVPIEREYDGAPEGNSVENKGTIADLSGSQGISEVEERIEKIKLDLTAGLGAVPINDLGDKDVFFYVIRFEICSGGCGIVSVKYLYISEAIDQEDAFDPSIKNKILVSSDVKAFNNLNEDEDTFISNIKVSDVKPMDLKNLNLGNVTKPIDLINENNWRRNLLEILLFLKDKRLLSPTAEKPELQMKERDMKIILNEFIGRIDQEVKKQNNDGPKLSGDNDEDVSTQPSPQTPSPPSSSQPSSQTPYPPPPPPDDDAEEESDEEVNPYFRPPPKNNQNGNTKTGGKRSHLNRKLPKQLLRYLLNLKNMYKKHIRRNNKKTRKNIRKKNNTRRKKKKGMKKTKKN